MVSAGALLLAVCCICACACFRRRATHNPGKLHAEVTQKDNCTSATFLSGNEGHGCTSSGWTGTRILPGVMHEHSRDGSNSLSKLPRRRSVFERVGSVVSAMLGPTTTGWPTQPLPSLRSVSVAPCASGDVDVEAPSRPLQSVCVQSSDATVQRRATGWATASGGEVSSLIDGAISERCTSRDVVGEEDCGSFEWNTQDSCDHSTDSKRRCEFSDTETEGSQNGEEFDDSSSSCGSCNSTCSGTDRSVVPSSSVVIADATGGRKFSEFFQRIHARRGTELGIEDF